jgi:hypothetical protein
MLQEALGDVARNYYRLVWVGRDDAGSPVVQTLLVHQGTVDPISTLPGIDEDPDVKLLDVFISADANAVLETRYVSTSAQDPLVAQIPAFVQKTDVMGFLGGIAALRGGPPVMSYTVARADLPFARASVTIRDTVVVPGTVSQLTDASRSLRDQLVIREARFSACAQKLASADVDAIASGLKEAVCTIPEGQRGLTTEQANTCRTFLAARLADAYRSTVPACTDAAMAGTDPVLYVDQQFADLVAKLRETRRGPVESRVVNAPLTRFSLGLLFGAVLGDPSYSDDNPRAKVGSNGIIIHDPLPTLLSMAVVNIHPRPYDPAGNVTLAERLRLFAGTVFTPDFGLTGGAGVMIVRGLSVNAGVAWLFVKSPAEGFSIGANTNSATGSPLQVGGAGVVFSGLSYVFK